MAIEKMSLYEALARKKTLKKRFDEVRSYRTVGIMKQETNTDIKTGITKEEVEKKIQSAFDSSVAALENYRAICTAINKANALTEVVIGGKSYTIADAIMYDRTLEKDLSVYRAMMMDYLEAETEVKKHADKYLSPEAIDKHISTALGDASKKDETLISSLRKSYIDNNSIYVYDPYNTKELYEKKLQEIEDFRNEIHTALTKVNCLTEIEVNFYDGPASKKDK